MIYTDGHCETQYNNKAAVIRVNNLYVHRKADCVLEDITFSIFDACMVGVIGPNGAGKSTLLNVLIGLQKYTSGTIFVQKHMSHSIAYVPQRTSVDWDFPVNVEEVVMMGRYPWIPFYKRPSEQDKEVVYNALCMVGMGHLKHKSIGELSGGQQQRVFFARALAQQPSLYFLDEPFAGIDTTTENDLIKILHNERAVGKTIVMVHHDLTTVQHYFDTILVLNKKLLYVGSPQNLDKNQAITNAYGRIIHNIVTNEKTF
ncbi:MAG TPA: metal ABC transporter ATP-binding protein [Patescibacteria group bacterium]|jgi:iron/zinc/copper transport system ATP-binding protein|nr:metal ABC transporter ATP-binding protein [Patescibacteria group bacterium]